jgi:hypothetical protein
MIVGLVDAREDALSKGCAGGSRDGCGVITRLAE